ncbi:hypothetical protein [Paenibacillus crassostreae]|uniref:Copper amine oxidase-like N-terminal domain-containing protein n=1 Tax=Paenibacillus crassostreae TaxID=1763538 RepID=A0A162RQP2_9BACL|nr:hypothetical protein [Paenibacillus crassostreae]AOZ93224.1 hypothetical protein LPB68_14070 [Paenibacillus crassostreae]OAB74047.1 hypothetical protein PNBC_12910 [Paenibacillus crassostreae]
MKPIWKLSLSVAVLGCSLWLGSLLNNTASGAGSTTQPGTSDDPVVTKSYVDQQIQKALGGGSTITTPSTTVPAPSTPTGNSPASSSDTIVIVDVKPGEKLIASAGAEFIVRNGKAIMYSQDTSGAADLTEGKDIVNGQAVATNHLLSFPRDGRGIMVQDGHKYGLVVMVRGSYSIQ